MCTICDPLVDGLDAYCIEVFPGPLSDHIWLYDYNDAGYMLRRAKYYGEAFHYEHHAHLLARAIRSNMGDAHTLLTFVPTIAPHVRDRGSDHCYQLGRFVAQYMGTNLTPLLTPTHSAGQASFARDQRIRNPHYLCSGAITGRNVVVIDDIATTRTTLIKAARALKNAGASRVTGVTVAYKSLSDESFSNLSAHRAQRA